MKKKLTKCCKNYNGMLDITNSCIFCKSYKRKMKKKYKVIIELSSDGSVAVRYKISEDKLNELVEFIKKIK